MPRGNPANLRPPWPPGVSGNPKGRRTAGASVREWVNSLVEGRVPAPALRKIADDEREEPARRAAAVRVLRMVEDPDLADFADAIEGGATLGELRDRGVPTRLIKRLKSKTRTLKGGKTLTTREIELHDRSGEDFDRVIEQTDGRPRQTVAVESQMPLAIEIITPMRELAHETGTKAAKRERSKGKARRG